MLFQRVSTQSIFFYIPQRTYGLHQTSVAIYPSYKAFSNDSSHSNGNELTSYKSPNCSIKQCNIRLVEEKLLDT